MKFKEQDNDNIILFIKVRADMLYGPIEECSVKHHAKSDKIRDNVITFFQQWIIRKTFYL